MGELAKPLRWLGVFSSQAGGGSTERSFGFFPVATAELVSASPAEEHIRDHPLPGKRDGLHHKPFFEVVVNEPKLFFQVFLIECVRLGTCTPMRS